MANYLRFFLFTFAGMGACLLSAYVNTFFEELGLPCTFTLYTSGNQVTGYGLDQEEHQDFARRLLDGLRERGLPAETLGGLQIGVTIGVHTGPTPIGVGILKREPGAVEN